MTLRLVALLLLLGACGGTKKTTIPVDSPLRPFVPPEEAPAEASPPAEAPAASQPAKPPGP